MANQLHDDVLRAQLISDMSSAWGTTRIYHSFMEVPAAAANLPLGFIALRTVEQGRDEDWNTFGRVQQVYTYDLIGLFAKATSGTVSDDRITRANLLMGQISTSGALGTYTTFGRDYLIREIRFSEREPDWMTPLEPVELVWLVLEVTGTDAHH